MLKEECAVDYKQKDDCGYYGITEGECDDRDCCWKPSPRVNDPECFYPKKNSMYYVFISFLLNIPMHLI